MIRLSNTFKRQKYCLCRKIDTDSGTKREHENDSNEFISKKLRPDPVLEDIK